MKAQGAFDGEAVRIEAAHAAALTEAARMASYAIVDARAKGAILFDIGGGSTEVVRIERPAGLPHAPPVKGSWTSLPLGVVTLAERFGGMDVTHESYGAMVEEVASHLAPFAAQNGSVSTEFDQVSADPNLLVRKFILPLWYC